MTLNTQVMGEVGSVRQLAESMRQLGAGVEEVASGWHRVRGTAEGVWEGTASDSFQQVADRSGKDGDEFARLHDAISQALTVFADEIDTVKARMAQAETAAHEGELTVFPGKMIYEPEAFTMDPPGRLSGRVSARQNADHAQQQAQFDAAKAANTKKQAAFAEAQATVSQARQAEKAAHEKLLAALNANTSALTQISSSGQWSKAAERPTTAAAVAIAGAATAMDDHAANATKSAFERALGTSPASVSACWASLSSAQRGDLMSRFPQMVGNADGLPAPVRSQANLSLLDGQRSRLQQRLDIINKNRRANPRGIEYQKEDELRDALAGLDYLSNEVKNSDNKYLLSVNALAHDRGQVIVASGNPDTASHVSTTVPGTFADLGNASDYVADGDRLMDRAQQFAHHSNASFSNITYADYESPPVVQKAISGGYANNGADSLARFQEGLRASHVGPPSHNTMIGHSYGTTAIGYAAQEHKLPVDDMAFVGTPGVGAFHASELQIPQDHVWSGNAGMDPIKLVPEGWYGHDPTDPGFGARPLPTATFSSHAGYWNEPESFDAMAKVVAGNTDGMPNVAPGTVAR